MTGPRRLDRGYFVWQRSLVDAYLADHGVSGTDAGMFCRILLAANHRTGILVGDLVAIAEYLGISRWTLQRLGDRLERARVVKLDRTNAPDKGGIVIVDYAELNPQSGHAQQGESGHELLQSAPTPAGESGQESGHESLQSATTHLGKRALHQEYQEYIDYQESAEGEPRVLTSPADNGARPPDSDDPLRALEVRFAHHIVRPDRFPPDEIPDTVRSLVTRFGTVAVDRYLDTIHPDARWRFPSAALDAAEADLEADPLDIWGEVSRDDRGRDYAHPREDPTP